MADLQGHDFRARVELTNKAGETIADVGESCARVNPASLGWLLEQRLIERISTGISIPAMTWCEPTGQALP